MPSSPIRSPLVLWANSTTNQLHEDWQSTGIREGIRLTQGDTVSIELHWLKSVAQLGLIHDEVIWPANANITLAIGRIDAPPEAGVFALGYGGQHTADISFDALASEVQTALNALSSVTADGGVTVSKTATTYKVVWNTPGVLSSSLTTYSNDLLPQSTIGIGLARAGASGIAAIHNIHVKQAPVAACNTWTDADGTDVAIAVESTVITGFEKTRFWTLDFSRLPRGGSFTFGWISGTGATGTSASIDVEAITASGIVFALQSSSGWGQDWIPSCTRRSALTYEVSIGVSTNNPAAILPVTSLSVTNNNVTDFSTKAGVLSLNTVEVEGLLAGRESSTAVMEIEVELDGSRQTLIQTDVVIVNDLIDTDVYDLVEWGSVIPADSVVRYDTSQSLTSGQKAQARNNIEAIDLTALNALIAKDTELELAINSQTLTSDELAAIKGADAPSGSNLVLTETAADALYAALTHQHLPADIIGLQTVLDGYSADIGTVQAAITELQSSKANTYHVQPTSTITGLDTILADFDTRIAGFAPFNHTHDIADVVDLEGRLATLETFQTAAEPNVPSTSQKAAIDNAEAPAALNPFVTESRVAGLLTGATAGFATQLYVGEQISLLSSALPTQYLSSLGDEPTSAPAGNLTTTFYNKEVSIVQDGVTYVIPARLP